MSGDLQSYLAAIDQAIRDTRFPEQPQQLYDPLRYILRPGGGKRIRPVLALMGCELFSGDFEAAKNAALAIELFHNFSLVHDDIMDKAPLRRGEATIHTRWNQNVAILSGDALLIEAYKLICTYEPALCQKLLSIFNATATQVCEGQQIDMDFEDRSFVPIEEYLEMIRLKTAVLLGCSLKMGALIGGSSNEDSDRLYQFGVNLGLAFQIQDDLLDVYAPQDKFGKQVGGDILANKKTYLLLSAFEFADAGEKIKLETLRSESDPSVKVRETISLYDRIGVAAKTQARMENTYADAIRSLKDLHVDEERKVPLYRLAEFLLSREF